MKNKTLYTFFMRNIFTGEFDDEFDNTMVITTDKNNYYPRIEYDIFSHKVIFINRKKNHIIDYEFCKSIDHGLEKLLS